MRVFVHRLMGGLVWVPLLAGGCGVAEDGLLWVQSLWSDEPPPAAPEEPVVAAEPAAAAGGTSTGGAGPSAATMSVQGTGGTSSGTGGEGSSGESSGSTTLLMSLARPPTTGTGGGTGASGTSGASTADASEDSGTSGGSEDSGGSGDSTGGSETGTAAPATTGGAGIPASAGVLACLEGSWDVDDLTTYFRHVIRTQAHGRSVRSLGESGRYTIEFSSGKIHGEAKHLRLKFSARLADQDISYSVDLHGTFDSTVRLEGADTLVIPAVKGSKIRAKETVRFQGGKTTTRRPKVPAFGRFEVKCDPKTLELRPLGGRKKKPAIRFVRPAP